MKLERYWDNGGETGISGLWGLCVDGTVVDGTSKDVSAISFDGNRAFAMYGSLLAETVETQAEGGVILRDDAITNTSDRPVTVTRALSRFTLPGGEYDVYTQANGWENESEGCWQMLTTRVSAENRGIRGVESAAPVLALYNRQTGHGIVFHVFSCCAWTLRAAMETTGESSVIAVEMGVNDKCFSLTLAPGERMALPRIVWYTFREKRDLECARLHQWFNAAYPRRTLPVIFNTWMMTFDRISPEHIMREATLAAEVGAEYFVIDAGWFGTEGRWWENIGAWEENQTGAFAGRMSEVAEHVRAQGMKFGLWLEIERALPNVPLVKAHPDWYFSNGRECFVDFGNAEARQAITDIVLGLIRRYGIEFIKFDFNADLSFDPTGCGFLRWHQGHEQFLRDVRRACPGIYLENCASGGLRSDLYVATLYDSCWISDNHSLYTGVRIVKDSALRLPTCCIERWPVLRDVSGFLSYDTPEPQRKLIACNDAGWGTARSVKESWLRTFVFGGPIGLSFDLEAVSEETRGFIKGMIAAFKEDRAFIRGARVSVLCDSARLTVLQYTGENGDIRLAVFVWNRRQNVVELYPEVRLGTDYIWNGEKISADVIAEDGLRLALPSTLDACIAELTPVR